MKIALLFTLLCCLATTSFALRATILKCLKLYRSWSEIDCSPHQDAVYEQLDVIWFGDYLTKIAEWLDNPLPPEWTLEEIDDYCLYRECRSNQAMVDYINIHGYAPYCMKQSVEDWVNDRFWARCMVRTNRSIELRPQDYATYYCYKVFRTQDPAIPCPPFSLIVDPNRPRIEELLKDKELTPLGDQPQGSEHWWVRQIRNVRDNSQDSNGNNVFHYGWIINKDTKMNQVPLWSPYQGPTVPVPRDISKIKAAMSSGGGNIMLGDMRQFQCNCDDSGALTCTEFGFLAYDPNETIVMVQTDQLILMGMTQKQDKTAPMKSALQTEADYLASLGY